MAAGGNVRLTSGNVKTIMASVTTDATTGSWHYKDGTYTTYHAVVTGTGAVTATVAIQVSNDGVNACETAAGTITLSGTTTSSDGFTTQANWKYVRAVLTNLTGTGATVNVYQGG